MILDQSETRHQHWSVLLLKCKVVSHQVQLNVFPAFILIMN